MINPVCPQLDYFWFALLIVTSVGTATLVPGVVVTWILRAQPASRWLKAMWRMLWIQTLLLSMVGTLAVWWQKGPDCFATAFTGGSTALTRVTAISWLAGFGLLLVVDFVGFILAAWERRRWLVHACPEFSELKDLFKLGRVDLAIGESGPAVMWGWPSCVVMPREFITAFDQRQRRTVLAHELAHVAGNDLWWAWPELILRRLLFFHPVMWMAARMYAEAQEMMADQAALKALRLTPRAYGETFLALIAWVQKGGRVPVAGAAAVSSFSRLERRLKNLANCAERPPGIWPRMLLASALCGSLTAAMVQARELGRGPLAEGGQCIQIRHEKFLEDVLHINREVKTCEQGGK